MNNFLSLFLLVFILSCNESSNNQNDVYGCTDLSATNYNEHATIDNQSCQYDDELYFNVNIEETGESTLFIFQDIIDLENGDEVGLFDLDGILDSNGNTGEILVGSGTWNNSQLSIIAIGSIDLSSFSGPILPGAVDGNIMILKVWDISEQVLYNASYNIPPNGGTGTFNGMFTNIDSITEN